MNKIQESQYWFGIIASLAWLIYAIVTPVYKYRDRLNVDSFTLSDKPLFKVERKTKSTWYSVELNVNENNTTYKISGFEYQYLNKEKLKQELTKGDTVIIIEHKSKVYSLFKNDQEYMNFDKSEADKKFEFIFMNIIMALLFVLCLIPLMVKDKFNSNYTINGIVLKYNYLFYVLAFIAICYVCFKISKTS